MARRERTADMWADNGLMMKIFTYLRLERRQVVGTSLQLTRTECSLSPETGRVSLTELILVI